jgi:hypothetical protein
MECADRRAPIPTRAATRRLLEVRGQENFNFERLNRNVDPRYELIGTWLVDEWSKIGVKATQRVVPTGPRLDAMRTVCSLWALAPSIAVLPNGRLRTLENPLSKVRMGRPRSGGLCRDCTCWSSATPVSLSSSFKSAPRRFNAVALLLCCGRPSRDVVQFDLRPSARRCHIRTIKPCLALQTGIAPGGVDVASRLN